VFQTLGIGRIHHASASTTDFFARPEETFKAGQAPDTARPGFKGSEAAFITTMSLGHFRRWGLLCATGSGAKNIPRDQHVVTAMAANLSMTKLLYRIS